MADTFNVSKLAEQVVLLVLRHAVKVVEEDAKAGERRSNEDSGMIIFEDAKRIIRDTVGGCLSRCQDDEPIFVLCARDRLAPAVIREWAEQILRFPDPDMTKVKGAQQVAAEMDRWPGEKKLPGTTKSQKVFHD